MSRQKHSEVGDELIKKHRTMPNEDFDRMYNSLDSDEQKRVIDEIDNIIFERRSRDSYFGHVPEGCAACGGPYPDCASSCPIFDD